LCSSNPTPGSESKKSVETNDLSPPGFVPPARRATLSLARPEPRPIQEASMKCVACWSVGSLALAALAGSAILGFAPAEAPAPAPAPAAAPASANTAFDIDTVHSSAVFRIQHAGVSNFHGVFEKITGSVTWDKASPESLKIDATIDAASVDSGNDGRDKHLAGPDFFNSKEHPSITFKSSAVKKTGDNTFDVTGDLTLIGKTKPVTIKVVHTGEKDAGARFGYRAGFDATFTIKRSDFGMTYGVAQGTLGDEVTLMVGFAAVRK
jgi:polyisoprenoid-binding protein YceI